MKARFAIVVGLVAALGLWPLAAAAQTYHDSGGTIVPGVVVVDPAAPAGGGTGALGTSGNPLHVTGGGSSFSGAVYPSGGAAGSSNGIGATDANAFAGTLSGASISGWSAPSQCTLPAGYGSLYFWQCLLTGVYGSNSKVQSASLENNHVIKNAAGSLFGFYCTAIAGGVAGYCVVVNSTTVPADGAVTPIDMCYFTTAAGCSLSRIPIGVSYATGMSAFISSATTPFTKTTGVLTGFISADYQ